MAELSIISKNLNSYAINGQQPIIVDDDGNNIISYVIYLKGLSDKPNVDSKYIWDFGDEYADNTNPNIVVVDNYYTKVKHTYTRAKKYTIRFIEKRKDNVLIETTKTIDLTGYINA